MKKYPAILAGIVAAFAMLMLVFASTVNVIAADYETEITSPFAETAPTIDGEFTTEDEWSDAAYAFWWFEPTSNHRDNNIYIYFMNDNEYIYLCFDVAPDNTSDFMDFVCVAVDENYDGEHQGAATSPEAEYWFCAYRDGYSYSSSYSNRIKYAFGFDGSPSEDYFDEDDTDYDHTIVEMAIPLSNFHYDDGTISAGDTIGFHAEGYGTLAPTWFYPKESTAFMDRDYDPDDAEDWAVLTLSEYVAPTPAPTPQPTVSNHAKDIGIWLMIIGVIVTLAAVAFRDELGRNYAYLVVLGVAIIVIGAINYQYEYIKTIPYILP